MEELLTTRQVLELLKVDRITVYRMLQDGRLKGVKIGQQWRFPQSEVKRLLEGEPFCEPADALAPNPNFPTHCVQAIQDLFSDVSQIGALILDRSGEPVTEMSGPRAFCRLMAASPKGQAARPARLASIAWQKPHGPLIWVTGSPSLSRMKAPIWLTSENRSWMV